MTDLGSSLPLRGWIVSSAAMGICRLRGLGKKLHLAVADLWLQDRVRAKDFALTKVAGACNPADVFPKYVPNSTMDQHIDRMGLQLEDGRPESAPTLTHCIFSPECRHVGAVQFFQAEGVSPG